MRRLPLHGYLKPLLPQCIASMGREITGREEGMEHEEELPSSSSSLDYLTQCRICHEEEDERRATMESPCGCCGSLKVIGTCIIVILVCFSWGNFLLETTINGDLMLYNCLCLCMQYAHRECVQRWCDEKGSTLCEICLQVGVSAFCSSIFLWKFSFSALSTKCTLYFLWGGQKVVISGGKCQLGSLYFVMDCN